MVWQWHSSPEREIGSAEQERNFATRLLQSQKCTTSVKVKLLLRPKRCIHCTGWEWNAWPGLEWLLSKLGIYRSATSASASARQRDYQGDYYTQQFLYTVVRKLHSHIEWIQIYLPKHLCSSSCLVNTTSLSPSLFYINKQHSWPDANLWST